MNCLTKIILREISEHGPMSIARYMELCLSHPEYGYYTTKQPFGSKGDFVTSPEISQMFGEMVGIWLVQLWHQIGRPNPFTLAELGPGRGTLMADILKVAKQEPKFLEAAEIILVETSNSLREQQRSALYGTDITFVDSVNELPEQPLIVVANEFFDALPIRQYIKNDFGWQERLIDSDFSICLSPTFKNGDFDTRFISMETGRIVEDSSPSRSMADVITKRISAHTGGAAIIDYGDFEGIGDTLQAIKNHEFTNIFSAPGEADITTHVRFSDLVQNGVDYGFSTQKEFLEGMGINARQKALETATGKSLQNDIDRLTGEAEMGSLFKVLTLISLPAEINSEA